MCVLKISIISFFKALSLEVSQYTILLFPWLSTSFDTFFIQFFLFYTIFLIFTTISLFYTVFYLFLIIIYLGAFLALYQLELFTAFLWLAECVVIFVSLMLLFYINVYDNVNNVNNLIYSKKNLVIFFGLFFLVFNCIFFSETEFFIPAELSISLFWDDFYEALVNDKMNDLFGAMLSFYLFNSFEFLLIGFLLLIGSMICVNLNRFLKSSKTYGYSDLFSIFDIFKDSIKMFFMRRQNLVNQETQPASTRVFKKKI